MVYKLSAFDNLVDALRCFPGIGSKTAERMALYLLSVKHEKVELLSKAMLEAKSRIKSCSQCFLFTEIDPCEICTDTSRDRQYICIIEQPNQAFVLERFGVFKGLYHVLKGKISPLEGIGPDDLHLKELVERVKKEMPQEIIIATGMDIEGEATAVYIANLLNPLGITTSRIAYGIPVGMGIDYADAQTLSRAIEGRRTLV